MTTPLYSFHELVNSIIMVAAHATNVLPDDLSRRTMEATLAMIFDKIWTGDAKEKELIIKSYEYWTGYEYHDSDDECADCDDSESIGSE